MKILNLIFILFTVSVLNHCSSGVDEGLFECNPENNTINFIFKYGVTSKNILNTNDCSYQKDLVQDPPVTTNLKLTTEELDSIFSKMLSIDFINYPDTFYVIRDPAVEITPSIKYYYLVESDTINKELYWNDSVADADTLADKLRYLNNYIIEIIESKKEYKELPEPSGGYDWDMQLYRYM